MKRVAIVVAMALAATAHAEPDTCRALPGSRYEQLPEKIRSRIASGDRWQAQKTWKTIEVSVHMARSPEVGEAALAECPGVSNLRSTATDVRRLASLVTVRVGSWAAIARIAQLPAVTSIRIFDADPSKIRHRQMPRPPPLAMPD